VPPGGYAWWYIDAESDDGSQALTLILFVGSVFSPHYHRACNQGGTATANPQQHCAVNLALYGAKSPGWRFNEYAAAECQRSPNRLQIGNSVAHWHQGALHVDLDEPAGLLKPRLRGSLILRPSPASTHPGPRSLHASGRHSWWPVAPCARLEVHLNQPGLRWSGRAYHDTNFGSEPLGQAFLSWHWQRTWHPDGTLIWYRPVARQGAAAPALGLLCRPNGEQEVMALPAEQAFSKTRWGLCRQATGSLIERRRLEDTPFYARALTQVQVDGHSLSGMHEQVDLQRFARPWVQFLLLFRLRRPTRRRRLPLSPS
jgi:carotenoid 1,2-hydratase